MPNCIWGKVFDECLIDVELIFAPRSSTHIQLLLYIQLIYRFYYVLVNKLISFIYRFVLTNLT